jgi:phage-related holin
MSTKFLEGLVVRLNDWEVFLHFLKRLFCETPVLKTITAIVLAVAQICWGPWTTVYETAALLWLGDWGLGSLCAWLDKADAVRSRRWYHALIKAILYSGVLFVGYQLRTVKVLYIGISINTGLQTVVLMTEGLSVLENLNKLGKQVLGQEVPFLSQMVKIVRGRQDKLIAEMEGSVEEK